MASLYALTATSVVRNHLETTRRRGLEAKVGAIDLLKEKSALDAGGYVDAHDEHTAVTQADAR